MGLALIERYILRKALISVLSALGGLIGVLWVIRAVQQVDVLLNKGQGIATYLKMTTLAVPTLAAAIAPIALLIGLIQTINTLNNDSELVVMHASGASRVSLLKPFIALSLLFTVLVYVLHLWVGPSSMQTLRTYVTEVRADLVSVIVREGQFQEVGDGLTFHIASRAPGGVLKGVFITDDRDEKESLTYMAKEGAISKVDGRSYLVLQDGQIQRHTNATENLSVIKFDSYAFNLSSFSGGGGGKNISQMEISTLDLINPDKNEALYKYAPGRYRAELHTRLTGGLYPLMIGLLILAYLGNPSSHRQGHALVIIAACGAVLILRGMTVVAEGELRGNVSMLYVVWGVPLGAMAVSAFMLATDRSPVSEKMVHLAENVLETIGAKLKKLFTKRYNRPALDGGVA